VTQRQGPNFREMLARFTVSLDGAPLSAMTPSKRTFTTRGSSTTELALLSAAPASSNISASAIPPRTVPIGRASS